MTATICRLHGLAVEEFCVECTRAHEARLDRTQATAAKPTALEQLENAIEGRELSPDAFENVMKFAVARLATITKRPAP